MKKILLVTMCIMSTTVFARGGGGGHASSSHMSTSHASVSEAHTASPHISEASNAPSKSSSSGFYWWPFSHGSNSDCKDKKDCKK